MRWLLALLLYCALTGAALAQQSNIYCLTGTSSTGAPMWAPASAGQPCPSAALAGGGVTVKSAITRSANTTTYTVNTGWNNGAPTVFSWANICQAAGSRAIITQVGAYSSANPTLLLNATLWLFNVTPGTVIADDATFNIASADFANLTGGATNGIPIVLQSAQASGAANSGVSLTGTNYYATCATGSRTLYGMVEVNNAYVPASGEVLTITLTALGAQ